MFNANNSIMIIFLNRSLCFFLFLYEYSYPGTISVETFCTRIII